MSGVLTCRRLPSLTLSPQLGLLRHPVSDGVGQQPGPTQGLLVLRLEPASGLHLGGTRPPVAQLVCQRDRAHAAPALLLAAAVTPVSSNCQQPPTLWAGSCPALTRLRAWRGSSRRRALGPAGTSFWEDIAGEVGRRAAQDLVLLFQQLVSPAQLSQLRRLVLRSAPARVTRGGWSEAVFPIGDLQSALQTGLRDPEIAGDLGDRRLALAGHSR